MDQIIERIQKHFELKDIVHQRDNLVYATVEKEHVLDLVTHLRDSEEFTFFVMMSAVDWIEEGKFQLTYTLNNPKKKVDMGVRTYINRENATMESLHKLWEHIATYQREMKEMFGIDFPGSPRVDESFILEGWDQMPPMRRDFDTKKYSEETYFPRPGRSTNDPAQYMKKKLYPDEEK